jgi:hypothetical protein
MRYTQEKPCGRRGVAALLSLLLASTPSIVMDTPARALSEIQREDLPPAVPGTDGESDRAIPLPGRSDTPADDDGLADPEEGGPDRDTAPADTSAETEAGAATLPEIIYDPERLPEPVRRMRSLIVEACRTGDLEALRPLIGAGDNMTQLSVAGFEGDPIEFLREQSGDEEGQEILAILLEVLEAGFVHLDAGTDVELYAWPYFFAVPLDSLDARQRVELFTIVTAGDYADMKTYSAYLFYRAGITPEGRWAFFVAGD